MHELPVMQRILEVVLRHARKHQVEQVAAVRLEVGQLSDLREEWMQRYFDHLTAGTVAEGARLKVERTPAVLRCRACGREFPLAGEGQDSGPCPGCGASQSELLAGRGYTIHSLEVV